jgi:3',5'-cyclic AMP phosphodiesterase CpdA
MTVRRIMHMSDLHFGRTDPEIVSAVQESARQLAPHLIAISGDLTQRARKREFAQARAFLHSLPPPKIVVPGNHDVPLYNVAARFLAPLERYKRIVSVETEPAFVDDEIVVVGVNTARSLVFKGGRINGQQVKRVAEMFGGASSQQVRILVTHHPFDLPRGGDSTNLVGRAAMALSSLRECAPDVFLAGHLHEAGTGTTAERYDLRGHSAIVVQAGTATSTRIRGSPNSFNLIQVDRSDIAVERFEWSTSSRAFSRSSTCCFTRRMGTWQEVDGRS